MSAWRYLENTRNYPGWHLTADTDGCASLIALLDAAVLDGMEGRRTLKIDRPTPAQLAVPNNRHAAWTATQSLRIVFEREPSQWRLRDEGERLELLLGTETLA